MTTTKTITIVPISYHLDPIWETVTNPQTGRQESVLRRPEMDVTTVQIRSQNRFGLIKLHGAQGA